MAVVAKHAEFIAERAFVAKRVGVAAVFDALGPQRSWSASCLVHRPCPTPTRRVLLPCAAATSARPWSELVATLPSFSESFASRIVTIRGRLMLDWPTSTAALCMTRHPDGLHDDGCCNHIGTGIVLVDSNQGLALDGFSCGGDDSRICCNAPAYGQLVVATGRLVRPEYPGTFPWHLSETQLCIDGETGAPQ
jgi:hypothetical protein